VARYARSQRYINLWWLNLSISIFSCLFVIDINRCMWCVCVAWMLYIRVSMLCQERGL